MNSECCLKPTEKPLCTCSYEEVLDAIGKKWAAVILNLLSSYESLGYNTLFEKISGITPKAFGDKLHMLESAGLVEKKVISERPLRTQYALTSEGQRVIASFTSLFGTAKKE